MPRKIRRPLFVAAGLILLLGAELRVLPETAHGFTPSSFPDSPLTATGESPDAPRVAGRWSYRSGSLVENGVRGLDGGIEYSVAADLCDRLIQRFVDEPKPRCEQLQEAVRRSFDRWADGHPVLRFTDVTASVVPLFPASQSVIESPRASARSQIFGAEINLFALRPAEYPGIRGAFGTTRRTYAMANPMGTHGRALAGFTIVSADIVLNAASCYRLDSALSRVECADFEGLMMHEIGHALGLDHPNGPEAPNYDTDTDPHNTIPIDCQRTTRGLKLSPHIDARAVMNSGRSGRWQPLGQIGLTNDDLGGRDFLYPTCHSADSSPSAPGIPSAGDPTARASASEPAVLYELLLATPFHEGALPPSSRSLQPDPGFLLGDPEEHAILGSVTVVSGPADQPGPTDAVGYTVYATDVDARRDFEVERTIPGMTVTNRFSPAGFEQPAQCFEYVWAMPGVEREFDGVSCAVLVGNVGVSGHSPGPVGAGTIARDHVLALTRAALAHFEKVRGQLSQAAEG